MGRFLLSKSQLKTFPGPVAQTIPNGRTSLHPTSGTNLSEKEVHLLAWIHFAAKTFRILDAIGYFSQNVHRVASTTGLECLPVRRPQVVKSGAECLWTFDQPLLFVGMHDDLRAIAVRQHDTA